jgi:hypothetical protein
LADADDGRASFSGDGTKSIYLWGAHLYRSDLGGMAPIPGAATGFEYYVPTNGAAEYLPRVGHHVYNGSTWVNEGLLIESEARTNLFQQSQDLTNVSVWVTAGTSPTRTDNNDGSFTLEDDNASGFEGITQTVGITSGTSSYTASVDIKKTTGGTSKTAAINFNLNGGTQITNNVRVNTDTGTILNVTLASIHDVGDYWRVSATLTDNASGNTEANVSLYPATDDHGVYTDDGTVVGSATFRYPQLELGSTPSSYIPTNNSTVTRGGQSLVVPANWYDVDNPTYTGPELVTNGTFDGSTSGWTLGNGMSLSNQSIVVASGNTGNGNYLYPSSSFTAGGTYILSVDVTETVAGNGLNLWVGSTAASASIASGSFSGSGTKTLTFTHNGTFVPTINPRANWEGSFDNVSVRQVSAPQFGWPSPEYIGSELVDNSGFDTDTDWTKGTGWTISNGVADCDGTQTGNTDLVQALSGTQAGKVYRVSTQLTRSAGSFRFGFYDGAGSLSEEVTESGEVVWYYVAARDTLSVVARGNSAFVGTIDNISVREINPLSVSFQMDGRMTYADEGGQSGIPYRHYISGSDYVLAELFSSGATTGQLRFWSVEGGTNDNTLGSATTYSPGILTPFNISSRHGSTFINGAVDGVALTADTTPTALPDLSNTDLQIAYDFMGTIGTFRQFAGDIGDAGLEASSDPGPSLSLTFDGSATSSFVIN